MFVQFGAAGGHSKAPPGLLHAVSRSALLTCTHTSLCDTYMHTPLRAHTASMRLCVSLCLHPSLPASHATHTHRVSLQEGVWLHAGERVRRRWPLRGRPSAVRQVSDGRRSHCVTHTHTPSLGEYALLRYGARFALCVHVPQGFGHACMRRPVGGYVSASYPPRYPCLDFLLFSRPSLYGIVPRRHAWPGREGCLHTRPSR